MRVLVFTSLFPSPAWPTQWVYHVNLVKALSEFADVRVVAPITWRKRLRHRAILKGVSRSSLDGVPIYHPTALVVPGLAMTHGPSLYLSVRPVVDQIFAEWPFDAILGIWAYPDVYAAGRLATRYGKPMVANVIGSDVNDVPNRFGMGSLVRTSLQSATTVIALSRALRDRVEQLDVQPSKIVVQYNGVDGDRFVLADKAEMRRRAGFTGGGPLICYVGNMLPEKGPDHLVEAFALLTQRPGVQDTTELVMIGDGPLLAPLRQRVAALGLERRLHLIGRKPNSEIASWLSAADALCLPSLREGCPNVVLEALASGRPVVASNVGGLPELIRPDTGILVPPAEPAALAEALDTALRGHWSPEQLRATVPCLSWREFGRSFSDVLAKAAGGLGQVRSEHTA